MKIVINPIYEFLTAFIEKLPCEDLVGGEMIRDQRNTIQKITIQGITLVIKRYKKPNSLNRFAYRYVRKSKARRAYEYALRLLDMGIGTAQPVAYIEVSQNGWFHTGYFISEYMTYPLLETIGDYEESARNKILRDFARFTVDLHHKGVVHKDYNLGNIFFYEQEGNPDCQFALIDINRMRFKRPGRAGCRNNLAVMGLPLPSLTLVAEEYAKIRGWNPALFSGGVLYTQGVSFRRRMKKIVKFILRPFSRKKKNR